jgi:hypothetical protein
MYILGKVEAYLNRERAAKISQGKASASVTNPVRRRERMEKKKV